MNVSYIIANTSHQFEDAKNLFQQYANSLDIDLSFQDFSTELNTIVKQYGKPQGALLLAYKNDTPIACVAIRESEKEIAELKRMFVKPEYRNYKIGQKLLEQIITISKELHYKKIRLDTLPSMTKAQELYRSYGFYEIPAYRFNPVKGTVFMEKKLD